MVELTDLSDKDRSYGWDCFQHIDKEGKFWSYLSDERLSCDFYIE